MNQRGSI